jgi:hypothetical protein
VAEGARDAQRIVENEVEGDRDVGAGDADLQV